jgi:segregation and condensation protein B
MSEYAEPSSEQAEPAPPSEAEPTQGQASAEAGEPAAEGQPAGEAASEQPPAAEASQANADPEHDLPAKVEAALLTADRALSSTKLAEALNVPTKRITASIETLNTQYDETGRSFRIEPVAKGWKVLTRPEYADVLEALHQSQSQQKLSPAAMETLAVIAYKQPILRADLEAIRGVACGEVLRSLMDRHLVKIVGRAEEIGRPMLYGTTKTFLEVFGLASLKDLPKVEQLTQPAE